MRAAEKTFCDGLLVMLELFAAPLDIQRQKNEITISESELRSLFPEIQTFVLALVLVRAHACDKLLKRLFFQNL